MSIVFISSFSLCLQSSLICQGAEIIMLLFISSNYVMAYTIIMYKKVLFTQRNYNAAVYK